MNYNSRESLLEFFRSDDKYTSCLEYCVANLSVTIEEILESGRMHDIFENCEVVPRHVLDALAAYREKILSNEQESINSEGDQDNSSFEGCPEDHACCHKYQLKLVKIQSKLDLLEDRQSKFESFIKEQFAKFDKPETTPLQNGDRVLAGRWILRKQELLECAANTSNNDLGELLEKVFGKGHLAQYSCKSNLPPAELEACNEIVDEYAKAKTTVGSGSFKDHKSKGLSKLARKLTNASQYQIAKKKRKAMKAYAAQNNSFINSSCDSLPSAASTPSKDVGSTKNTAYNLPIASPSTASTSTTSTPTRRSQVHQYSLSALMKSRENLPQCPKQRKTASYVQPKTLSAKKQPVDSENDHSAE